MLHQITESGDVQVCQSYLLILAITGSLVNDKDKDKSTGPMVQNHINQHSIDVCNTHLL
jgi:hypothetical protein